MLRKISLSIQLILLASIFLFGSTTAVQAKGEQPPNFNTMDVAPAVIGTVTFAQDWTGTYINFTGKCKNFNVSILHFLFPFDLQHLKESDLISYGPDPLRPLPVPVEFEVILPPGSSARDRLSSCYGDLGPFDALTLVFKSVMNFIPDAPEGSRTSITADVVFLRRVPK